MRYIIYELIFFESLVGSRRPARYNKKRYTDTRRQIETHGLPDRRIIAATNSLPRTAILAEPETGWSFPSSSTKTKQNKSGLHHQVISTPNVARAHLAAKHRHHHHLPGGWFVLFAVLETGCPAVV